jgi:hypothetical protein
MFCAVDACFMNAFDQLFAFAPLWEVGCFHGRIVDFTWITGKPELIPGQKSASGKFAAPRVREITSRVG